MHVDPVLTVLAAAPKSEGLRLASLFGYTGFFGLSATVLLGMAKAVDRPGKHFGGEGLEQVHLAAAVLGLCGVAGHIVAHMVRVGAGWGAAQALVPFVQGGWIVAAGIASWLLLVVVAVTMPLRRVLGYRGWLVAHRAAYAAALLMVVHVVAASDEVARFAFSGVVVLATVAWLLLGVRVRLRGSDDFRGDQAVPRRTTVEGRPS